MISDDALPVLTEDNTTIDGSDQWDNLIGKPGVELKCISCDHILRINANDNTVRGILFAAGMQSGIRVINGNSNTMVGSDPGQ